MDPILRPWLNATDEAECERLLDELTRVYAAPFIRLALRQRLGFYVSQAGISHNPDAQDLYHDVLTSLIAQLHQLKSDPDKNAIRNYRQYVTRVAMNCCHSYLRGKAPLRSRLKSNLRYLLESHQDFTLHKNDDGRYLCGLAAWERRKYEESAPAPLKIDPELFRNARFAEADLQQVSHAGIMAEIFNWLKAPVELDELTGFVAALLEVRDQPLESLDQDDYSQSEYLTDPAVSPDLRLEQREWLLRVWDEVKRLPQRQRDTVCLSYLTESGDDL